LELFSGAGDSLKQRRIKRPNQRVLDYSNS